MASSVEVSMVTRRCWAMSQRARTLAKDFGLNHMGIGRVRPV